MRIDRKAFSLKIDDGGVLRSLKNQATDDEYIKIQNEIPLFYLDGFDGDDRKKLLPECVEKDGSDLLFHFFEKEITARITFETAREEVLAIRAAVENRSEFRICETVGPNLYGLCLGKDYRKNVFIYPHHAGEKTVNPMDRYREDEYRQFFRAYVVPTDHHTLKRQINYCGLASMSFMYLYDGENGLYFGSHDSTFPVTTLTAEVGTEERFMGLSFTKHYDINKGERYASGEYVIAVNRKDWHEAKNLYRPYLLPHIKLHNYPDYLDDQYALNQCYNFKRQGKAPENTFADIPRMYEYGKSRIGANHMFLASWNRGGFDTDYPEYYPDMDLGTGMDFFRGLRYIKEHGGISTLYINARIFDKEGLYHGTVGKRMAMLNYDGNAYEETYGTKTFTVSCPSDEEWQHRLTDTAEYLVHSYGATGVYLDQLGSAEPFPCYNPNHSHTHIGDFNNGYLSVLSDLSERLRKYSDKSYILTENIGDIYASYTFGNLTWNSPNFDEYYNVIKYIFPEFVQINMVNPNADEKRFWRKMQYAVLLGSVMWYSPTVKRSPELLYQDSLCEKCIAFRASYQDDIKRSVFEDDKYVTALDDGLEATVFENEDMLVLLVGDIGLSGGEAEVTLPFVPKSIAAYDLDLSDATGSIKANGNRICYTAKSRFSKILIQK